MTCPAYVVYFLDWVASEKDKVGQKKGKRVPLFNAFKSGSLNVNRNVISAQLYTRGIVRNKEIVIIGEMELA